MHSGARIGYARGAVSSNVGSVMTGIACFSGPLASVGRSWVPCFVCWRLCCPARGSGVDMLEFCFLFKLFFGLVFVCLFLFVCPLLAFVSFSFFSFSVCLFLCPPPAHSLTFTSFFFVTSDIIFLLLKDLYSFFYTFIILCL